MAPATRIVQKVQSSARAARVESGSPNGVNDAPIPIAKHPATVTRTRLSPVKCSSPITSTSTSAPTIAVMMLEMDAITKMLAAVSTGRDTRPRSRLKATSRLVRAHPKTSAATITATLMATGSCSASSTSSCVKPLPMRVASTPSDRQ